LPYSASPEPENIWITYFKSYNVLARHSVNRLIIFTCLQDKIEQPIVEIGSQPMQAILLSSEEVAKRAYQFYEGEIRQKVEIEKNIGKMVIINVETGDYEVDETGLQAAKNLQAKSPYARLFGIRIGYNVAASFGGVMERVSSDFRYCN
jgi:hypothetical protein